MTALHWFLFVYALGGAMMFAFCQDLQHGANKAWRIAVIWPFVVGTAAGWLLLSFGIILRERLSS
jgi:hypothetical protein